MSSLWILALACGRGTAPSLAEDPLLRSAPTTGAALSIAITGDTPYDPPGQRAELDRLEADVSALTGVELVVHLGDLKRGRDPCTAATYRNAADAMCASAVPAFVLPGDNEWNDCERTRDKGFDTVEAWRHWDATFGPSADRCAALTPPTDWRVLPQVRPDQTWWPGTHTGGFRFDRNGVRVVGLALPSFVAKDHGLPGDKGTKVRDLAIAAMADALASPADAVIVLLHADVFQEGANQDPFREALSTEARRFGRPVLVVVGDSHSFDIRRPFDGVDLTYVVVERGGREAPLTVEVRPGADPAFHLVRGAKH